MTTARCACVTLTLRYVANMPSCWLPRGERETDEPQSAPSGEKTTGKV
jgi:hypothetical protein